MTEKDACLIEIEKKLDLEIKGMKWTRKYHKEKLAPNDIILQQRIIRP